MARLGYRDISVVSRQTKLPPEFSTYPSFCCLQDALSTTNYHAAIICTPTALHMPSLLSLLQAKVPNIYVEKPVSHSQAGLDQALSLANAYNSRVVVGYDLHFEAGLQKVKQLLNEGAIGKLASANVQVGQYLPDWRPHEDYRNGMSASRQMGGGVMLDLVHEFDYLLWLCGSIQQVACFYQNTGALQIETEDIAEVLFSFSNGAIGTIHLDYLQQKLVRNCLLTGHHGSIQWNLAEGYVRHINQRKEEQLYDVSGYERNDRFVEIISAFLTGKNDDRLTTLPQAIESLRLVLAAKFAAEKNTFVQLNAF